MPPRIMHVITAAFKDVFTQNTLSSGFMEIPIVEYQALQAKLDAMQSSLDEHAEKEIAALDCTSVQDAKLLRETYNSQWFTNSNYSVDTLQKLALALLELTEPYAPGYTLWVNVMNGDIPQKPVAEPPVEPSSILQDRMTQRRIAKQAEKAQ